MDSPKTEQNAKLLEDVGNEFVELLSLTDKGFTYQKISTAATGFSSSMSRVTLILLRHCMMHYNMYFCV